MILQFNKKYNFAEKIINSIPSKFFEFATESEYIDELLKYRDVANTKDIKIHTIRDDFKNRWNVGRSIHFCEWSKKPYNSRNIQFAPLMTVLKIQNVKILEYFMTASETSYKMPDDTIYGIEIDGIRLKREAMYQFSKNDGFPNLIEFFKYFKRFEGKIIHWTDFAY